MPARGNGAKPNKTPETVATELRHQLEERLGRERTDAIWQDPTAVKDVLHDGEEAASVAGIILQAWRDLPEEEPSTPPKQRSGFRRGLRLALIASIAVWALSILKKSRQGEEGEGQEPL